MVLLYVKNRKYNVKSTFTVHFNTWKVRHENYRNFFLLHLFEARRVSHSEKVRTREGAESAHPNTGGYSYSTVYKKG